MSDKRRAHVCGDKRRAHVCGDKRRVHWDERVQCEDEGAMLGMRGALCCKRKVRMLCM